MYEVEFTNQAEKALSSVEAKLASRLFKKIHLLKTNQFPHDVKPLKGTKGGYRIRVGSYRVLYSLDHELRVVLITRIDKRSKVY